MATNNLIFGIIFGVGLAMLIRRLLLDVSGRAVTARWTQKEATVQQGETKGAGDGK